MVLFPKNIWNICAILSNISFQLLAYSLIVMEIWFQQTNRQTGTSNHFKCRLLSTKTFHEIFLLQNYSTFFSRIWIFISCLPQWDKSCVPLKFSTGLWVISTSPYILLISVARNGGNWIKYWSSFCLFLNREIKASTSQRLTWFTCILYN